MHDRAPSQARQLCNLTIYDHLFAATAGLYLCKGCHSKAPCIDSADVHQ